jgi:hypothetical protein
MLRSVPFRDVLKTRPRTGDETNAAYSKQNLDHFLRAYVRLPKRTNFPHYRVVLSGSKAVCNLLPQIERGLSGTKAFTRGANHSGSGKRLQSYPREVFYRFNCCFWRKDTPDPLISMFRSTEITYFQFLINAYFTLSAKPMRISCRTRGVPG